jgi:hypothetical protein
MDNTAAQQEKPFLMRLMVSLELKECIVLDDMYNKEHKVKGYESN